MDNITFLNRITKRLEEEKVYGKKALDFVYGDTLLSRWLGRLVLHAVIKFPFFSWCYGLWQKSHWSKRKVEPFITEFSLDSSEFLLPVESFNSFNAFFIRKLKSNSRPINKDPHIAIIPADARYLFYNDVDTTDGFVIKGERFSLKTLLGDKELAERYSHGGMVIARLCPTDYHRFHFPCDSIPQKTKNINGYLFSVNPIALKKNLHFLTKNKRNRTLMDSEYFGTIAYVEVGATNVGSITQTFTEGERYHKGDEKGYFAFGASTLILLFEKGKIYFDDDLLKASQEHLEVRCLMGQSMGRLVK